MGKTFSKDFDVDVVYTWVNSDDKKWKRKYNNIFGYNDNGFDARIQNTINSWDEIELSIKLLRKNLPWVNNIYVVTIRPQTLPKRIIDKYNIIIIHHDEIGINHLTFNSMSIECNIHKIPNLSERFIYFNDDAYITKYINKSDLFTKDGLPISIINESKTFRKLPKINNYMKALNNCKYLINSLGFFFLCIDHFPSPSTKSVINKTSKIFSKDWDNTSKSIIRSPTNIIPLYLASALGMSNNEYKYSTSRIKRIMTENEIPKNIKDYHMVCINSISRDKFIKLKYTFIDVD